MDLQKASIPIGRGLRQGDPVSPFLFLIVMIKGAVRLFEGFRVAENTPSINHLQFADDTLIFVETTKNRSEMLNQPFYAL